MKNSFTITSIDPAAGRAFDAWCTHMGFRNRRDAFYFIVRAMQDGRIAIYDKATKAILVGAAREETLLESRLAARREARNVLWEEGFISDPVEDTEIINRAKP